MKTWKTADIEELNVAATAYGRNPHAKEANADKNPNNGAGGSLLNELDKNPDYTDDGKNDESLGS